MGKTIRTALRDHKKIAVHEKVNHFDQAEKKQNAAQQARLSEQLALKSAINYQSLDDLAMPIRKKSLIKSRR